MFALELIFPHCRQPSVLHNVATLLQSVDFNIDNLPEKGDYENEFKLKTCAISFLLCITDPFLKS